MTAKRDDYDSKAYNPEFERHFLSPKYWGTWLSALFIFASHRNAAKNTKPVGKSHCKEVVQVP